MQHVAEKESPQLHACKIKSGNDTGRCLLELVIMITFDATTLRSPSLVQSFWQESGYARVGSCIGFSLVMHIDFHACWKVMVSSFVCNDCIMLFSLWDINLICMCNVGKVLGL